MVTPQDELRLAHDSYSEAAKKLQLEFKEDPGTDRFLFDENTPEQAKEGDSAGTQGSGTEKLPEGFSVK